jgi:hypothetical protein
MHRDTADHVRTLQRLQDPRVDPQLLRGELMAMQIARDAAPDAIMQPWGFWLSVLCVLGLYAETFEVAEGIAGRVLEVGATISQLTDHAFFGGLAAAALAGEGADRRRARRAFQRHLRQLRVWAQEGPDFRHMVLGLEAEQARLAGQHRQALARYADAAERAGSKGYRQHAALLLERRAGLLQSLRRGTEAASALSQALALYEEWGAHAKVAQLRSGPAQPPSVLR